MSDLVDVIRAERMAIIEPLLAPVAEQLRTLEEMERLALSLNGGGSDVAPAVEAPKPPASKPRHRALPKTSVAPVGRDGLGGRAEHVLSVVRSLDGWVAAGEIAAACGLTPHTVKRPLQTLVARGLIEARGHTAARRYRSVVGDNGASGGGERLALTAPKTPKVEASKPEPRRSVPDLPARERGIARARILDHCSRRKLDEQTLATILGVDREAVADLCGELLLDDKIILLPSGHYEVPS